MRGRYLLDTNVVIALLNGELAVQRALAEAPEAFLSIFTLGELFYGAYKSVRIDQNLARIEDLATATAVLEVDPETARHYGMIKTRLLKRGKPIPENDIWNAALARQYGLTLVSRDGHFLEVDDLWREAW
ncbi:MAG TPA: type II toxin-antitoxin system VapC family toxin [Thermoanaerobaculia bacterium]|nr:type II toxin-antitoxin system VapC family toxin [Thermoanaerobaculia bacterium]